ncbi:hypothetical protein ACHWQZ_G009201 [Mnemiopsis leidyi]
MVMEHFVTPFLGIPFPMQAASESSSNGSHKVSSTSTKSSSLSNSRKSSRKRRKLSGMKRIAATTRERSRIEHLNCAFITLRSRIPTQPSDVKLTKVETLRLAMSYIMHLEKLVGDIKAQEKETGSSEDDVVACPRVVRVYPSYPAHSEHLPAEFGSWNPQYGLPVRPIPTMDTHFILKKGDKN